MLWYILLFIILFAYVSCHFPFVWQFFFFNGELATDNVWFQHLLIYIFISLVDVFGLIIYFYKQLYNFLI